MDFDELEADIDWLCGTDSTSYALADKARNMNRHYYLAILDILKTSDRFQFDDRNHSTLPISDFTLVAGQKDYSLPTNLLKVHAIEVTDAAGNVHRLKEMDAMQDLGLSITDFEDTDGLPQYYDPNGDSLMLYPSPSAAACTLVNGGTIYFSRDVDAFTSSDTTQKPGIPTPFHRILSLGASYDWMLVNGPTETADRFLRDQTTLRKELTKFYSDRNKDTRTKITTAHKTQDSM